MDTSAWMRAYKTQVVERRREQAAEVVEPRLERRPRNPVVYSIHSRRGGNDHYRQATQSGACKTGQSLTPRLRCLDSGLRRNDDTGFGAGSAEVPA